MVEALLWSLAIVAATGMVEALALVEIDRRHRACRHKLTQVAAERDALREQRQAQMRREIDAAFGHQGRAG